MRIEEAIQQKDFHSEFQKLQINILYTAAWLGQQTSARLKPFGITWQQFNVLRILRGRKGQPATVKLLTERMIDKMSNASRLVDKLVGKGLVERKICENDRRRVDIFLTESGLELVNDASRTLEESLEKEMADNITHGQAQQLNDILDQLRSEE